MKPGDRVAQFDNICEVQSDKASVTITSKANQELSHLIHSCSSDSVVDAGFGSARIGIQRWKLQRIKTHRLAYRFSID